MKLRLGWLIAGFALLGFAANLLGHRGSYEPGPVLAAHAQLSGECSACHQPWRGPTNQACIACHGNFTNNNPHAGESTNDPTTGLTAGKRLVSFNDQLACLSCHREHHGAHVKVNVAAAFACSYCHQHPSIVAVDEHMAPVMLRKFFVKHIYAQPFNHYLHRQLITSAYPPRPGGFTCDSCHETPPIKPGEAERMSLKWSGCAGAGCHIVPQDSFMQMPASVGPLPKTIAYSSEMKVRHINAAFVHSAGHLQSNCDVCHFQIPRSTNPDDYHSLAIERCFDCHAHQPALAIQTAHANIPDGATPIAVQSHTPMSPLGGRGIAFAATGAQAVTALGGPQTMVVACGDCHLFHTYGVLPLRDFPNPAPEFPPGVHPGLRLTAYVPSFLGGNGATGFHMRRVSFQPWPFGIFAFTIIGLSALGFSICHARQAWMKRWRAWRRNARAKSRFSTLSFKRASAAFISWARRRGRRRSTWR
jgi:hypothetical protein